MPAITSIGRLRSLLPDLRARACDLGARIVEPLERDELVPEELFLALEVRFGEPEVRFGLRELGTHGLDLGRSFRLPQVLELSLGASEPVRGFAPLRRLVLLLEREELAARPHLVAALHRESRELAGERRGDADVLALGVALEALLRRVVAAGGERGGGDGECVLHRGASGAPHRSF